jgi:hypothetical protein
VQVVSSISILFVVVSTVGMTLNTMVYFQHQVITYTSVKLSLAFWEHGLFMYNTRGSQRVRRFHINFLRSQAFKCFYFDPSPLFASPTFLFGSQGFFGSPNNPFATNFSFIRKKRLLASHTFFYASFSFNFCL